MNPPGYVGLLLGVALFHIVDLVNMFLDRTIKGYIKNLDNCCDEKTKSQDTLDDSNWQLNQIMRIDSENFC